MPSSTQGSFLRENVRFGLSLVVISFLPLIILKIFFTSVMEPSVHRYQAILKAGKIRVGMGTWQRRQRILEDNTAMIADFETDLASLFAKRNQIVLEVVTIDNENRFAEFLRCGRVDVILGISREPLSCSGQMLISEPYRTLRYHLVSGRNDYLIKDISELEGLRIHISEDMPYVQIIEHIRHLGIYPFFSMAGGFSSERLVESVAHGRIRYAIVDYYRAVRNKRYFPDLEVGIPVFEQQFHWAVHPDAAELHVRINEFFKNIEASGVLKALYERHLMPLETFDYVDTVVFHRRLSTRLPKYIKIIKEAAGEYGFEWRLIVAQVYQESHFNKWAESDARAYGLMQLTRSTARRYGIKNIVNPRQNIHTGVQQLRKLYDFYDNAQDDDRLLISLAAYNIGIGHILDARNLARQKDLDPNRWDSLVKTLPLLERPEYFEKAKYGYCHGSQAVTYVRQIMFYYDILAYLDPAVYLAGNEDTQ